MKPDAKVITYSPVIAQLLLEWANVSQLIRMWTERTAAGQSLIAWFSVNAAILLFINYYRVLKLRVPMWSAVAGFSFNCAVIVTVVYFRYVA